MTTSRVSADKLRRGGSTLIKNEPNAQVNCVKIKEVEKVAMKNIPNAKLKIQEVMRLRGLRVTDKHIIE